MQRKIDYIRGRFKDNRWLRDEFKKDSIMPKEEFYVFEGQYLLFLGICVFYNRVEFALIDVIGKDRTKEHFDTNVVYYEGQVCVEGRKAVLDVFKKIAEKDDIAILSSTVSVYGGIHYKEERTFSLKREKSNFIVYNLYADVHEAKFAYDSYTVAAEDAAGIYIADNYDEIDYVRKSYDKDFVFYDPLTGCISCFNDGALIQSQGKYGNLTSKDPLDVSMLKNMQCIEKENYFGYIDENKKQFGQMLIPYLTAISRTMEPTNIIIGGEAIRYYGLDGFWRDYYVEALKQVNENVTKIHSLNTSSFNTVGAATYGMFRFFGWNLNWDKYGRFK